ncbi:MAG: membrane protease YdiL (CAAX protease family) [Marivirga sp.]
MWQVSLPWILLATINPWLEEFYWRGLVMDYTKNWPNWTAVLFTSLLFALNHAVFGVNSELNNGLTVIISTFIMGIIWGLAY